MGEFFGNPSSGHGEGLRARARLKEAREAVAASLHVPSEDLYFTSGGTISDNISIFGGAKSGVGKHIVTTATEHHAVLHPMQELQKRGFDVTFINPDESGNISEEKIVSSLRSDTCLVSIMRTNNETGAIYPVENIRAQMDKICPRALFHVDAVQAFGKEELFPLKWGIDMLSVSGHKIHAPKGIGALYIKKGVSLSGYIFGGGQEKNIHSGTENLPGAVGFMEAVKNISYDDSSVREINLFLRDELTGKIGAEIISPDNASPYILCASFPPIPSEVILNALAGEGICASAGSACAANRSGESHVIKAMGKSPKSIIRFSFSQFNTMDEAKKLVEVLENTIPMLRMVIK